MSFDATMKFSTNMSRQEIEAKIPELKKFAEAAGLGEATLRQVFLYKTMPLSEYVQRRTSKAYQSFAAGELQVMANRDNTRFVQYRKVAKPALKRENKIVFNNGMLQLKIGITNKVNYDQPTLDDQLKGKVNG